MNVALICLLALDMAQIAHGLPSSGGAMTVSEFRSVKARDLVMVGVISDDAFKRMALSVLGPKTVSLGKLVAYETAQDRVIASRQPADHCSYGVWRATVEAYRKNYSGCPAVKEAVKIGDSIVVRTVSSGCRRTRIVLKGSADPLLLDVAGRAVEILEISVGPLTSIPGEQQVAANFYCRTATAISKHLAETLTSYLIGLTGIRAMGVVIRPDVWFVTDCGFPTIYPFEDFGSLPSYDWLVRAPGAGCAAFTKDGKVSCGGVNLAP